MKNYFFGRLLCGLVERGFYLPSFLLKVRYSSNGSTVAHRAATLGRLTTRQLADIKILSLRNNSLWTVAHQWAWSIGVFPKETPLKVYYWITPIFGDVTSVAHLCARKGWLTPVSGDMQLLDYRHETPMQAYNKFLQEREDDEIFEDE